MRLKIWAAMIAVYLSWGSTYLAIRIAVETMPPFLMAGVRFLIAGGILYGWRRLAGDAPPQRIHWRSAAIVGFFLLLGGNGAVTWAEQYVVSGVAALLVSSAPLWMVIMDAVRPGGVRPNWQTALGILAGFSGIVILVGPADLLNGKLTLNPVGVAALLLAAFLWAVGSLYNRSAQLPDSPLMGAGMEMMAGGVGLTLLGSLTGEWGRLDLAAISANSLWGLLYLIFFGSLVGFAAYLWLLRVAPTPLVATYAYVNPLIAILVGNVVAHEPLTGRLLLAALVIVGAVALINAGRAKAKQLAEAEPTPSPGDA
ncbi:MAG: EamA family transporter [Chloroflexi bacterium]|nr:EamA family transporter [Chloroflexota bacterium]